MQSCLLIVSCNISVQLDWTLQDGDRGIASGAGRDLKKKSGDFLDILKNPENSWKIWEG